MTTTTLVVQAAQVKASSVTISGYFYIVDLGDLIHPRHHHVAINGECTCTLRRNCPAVHQVRQYLADGGQRPERPPFGFYPVHPAKCPIKGCGAPAYYDASLSSHNRGVGWVCSTGGKTHYWLHRAWITAMRRKLALQGRII